MRTETRGAHARSDFPEPSDAWRCRIVHDGPERGTVLAPATGDAQDDSAGRSPQ